MDAEDAIKLLRRRLYDCHFGWCQCQSRKSRNGCVELRRIVLDAGLWDVLARMYREDRQKNA